MNTMTPTADLGPTAGALIEWSKRTADARTTRAQAFPQDDDYNHSRRCIRELVRVTTAVGQLASEGKVWSAIGRAQEAWINPAELRAIPGVLSGANGVAYLPAEVVAKEIESAVREEEKVKYVPPANSPGYVPDERWHFIAREGDDVYSISREPDSPGYKASRHSNLFEERDEELTGDVITFFPSKTIDASWEVESIALGVGLVFDRLGLPSEGLEREPTSGKPGEISDNAALSAESAADTTLRAVASIATLAPAPRAGMAIG